VIRLSTFEMHLRLGLPAVPVLDVFEEKFLHISSLSHAYCLSLCCLYRFGFCQNSFNRNFWSGRAWSWRRGGRLSGMYRHG